ncbi:MAG: hypothetical protein WAU60_12095 [Candidatus Competibacter denitrificans]|jgi:hypothetical protein
MKGFLSAVLIILGILAGLAVGGFYFLDRLFSDLCGNEIFQEKAAPKGRFKAVLFQRDCGATTGFSTQVSLIPVDAPLPNESGNVFVTNSHPQDTQINLQWRTPENLLIRNGVSLKTIKQEVFYQGIRIDYE